MCSPLTMAHTLFHDVGVETLYTGYSIGYTVRPMHILFRPCGLTLNKRNDRQRIHRSTTEKYSARFFNYLIGLGLGFGVRVLVVVRV